MISSELGVPVQDATSGMSAGKDRFLRYLLWLAIAPFMLYVAGFLLVGLPGYERWSGSSWGPSLDYAFQTAGQNADVVIFGDSSALLAVDPVEMSRQLGMKVVNLPNTIGSLPVIGDMALQRYLKTNRPPRLIIFYFCPWDLDYAQMAGTRIFEGEEMLVRHGSWHEIEEFSFHHPRELFYFPFRVFSSWSPAASIRALAAPHSSSEVVAFHGHVPNFLPIPTLGDVCSLPAANIEEHRTASVRRLMVSYTNSVTQTMLYLAPVPHCVNVDLLLSATRQHLQVSPPPVFPAAEFTADSYYAHLVPKAVPVATHLLADATRTRLLDSRSVVMPLP